MQPKGRCCRDKAVLVSVYVERPRRRRKVAPSSPNLHHHLCIREQRLACLKACRNGGYDRKAKLLLYSQHLREAARQQSLSSVASTNLRQISSNNRPQPQITKILSLRRRNTRRSPIQACFGDWKRLFIPGFLRSFAILKGKKNKNKSALSQATKIKTITSSETKKKWAFIPKLFAKFYKSR